MTEEELRFKLKGAEEDLEDCMWALQFASRTGGYQLERDAFSIRREIAALKAKLKGVSHG